MLGLNPDTQPNELFRTERGDDRLQTVMTTGRAAFANANLAHGQSEVVGNHYQLLYRLLEWRLAFELAQQAGNSAAAQVHERLWLGQSGDNTFDCALAHERVALASFHEDPFIVRQFVNQHEPEVMARVSVVGAGIAKTNDEQLLLAFSLFFLLALADHFRFGRLDRKSTRLNSSHSSISYAVFCLKKKKTSSCT